MAKKRRVIRRRQPRRLEEVEEDELEELEDEEEEEEEAPAPRSRRRNRQPDPEPEEEEDEEEEEEDDEDYDDEEEEEEELPPPPAKRTQRRRPAVEEEEDEEEEAPAPKAKKVKLEKVDDTMVSSIVLELLLSLEDGQAVLFQKSDGGFSISTGEAVETTKKLKGKAYWEEVTDPKYREWDEEWREKSYEEKVKFAKKQKLEWNEHENPRVDVIRLTQAVREHLGIEKYKPQYRTRSAREAVKA